MEYSYRMAPTWDLPALRTLRRRYGHTPNEELAALLGRTPQEVQAKAEQLALSKDKRMFKGRPMPRWSAKEIETLRREYPTRSGVELAHMLGRSVKSIVSRAYKMKLKKDEERLKVMGKENVALRYADPQP